MGMYDDISVQEGLGAVCPAGHTLSRCQTKDLDNAMNHYHVIRDAARDRIVLMVHNTLSDRNKVDTSFEVSEDAAGKPVVKEITVLTLKFCEDISGTVCFYTSCDACDPVCCERPEGTGFGHRIGDNIDKHQPWQEFELSVRSGIVEAIKATRCDTRDALRRSLAAAGHIVLPDDDRVVRRVIEQHRREQEEERGQ